MEVMNHTAVSTINELIDLSAAKYKNSVFMRYIEGSIIVEKTYEDIRHDSYAVCRYIRSLAKEQLHIAFIGKTDYNYITAVTGALMSGSTVIPLSPELSADENAALMRHSDTNLLFCANGLEKAAQGCTGINKIINLSDKEFFSKIYSEYDEKGTYAELSSFEPDPDACALIMYTSGTTGEKKGVMLSMRAIVENSSFRELTFNTDDITLSVLPMHHIFCFSSDYIKNIMDGVTVCLNGDISNIEKNLLVFEPTIIRLVPVMIASLLRKTRIIKKRHPNLTPRQAAEQVFGKRMRWITSSGAYLSPDIINEFEEMGIKIRQAYGMTEAGPRISVPDDNTAPDSVGRIISTCEVRTVSGEIQVKSPSIMMGYYKNPKATREMITEDGWLRTGDIGRIMPDRQLYITGRLKNLIILSNGENVSPEEIEKKYADEHYIKEIIVYEKDDRIAADIYPDYAYLESSGITDIEGAIEDTVQRINAEDIAAREIDTYTIRTQPLPKTSSGKLKRQ